MTQSYPPPHQQGQVQPAPVPGPQHQQMPPRGPQYNYQQMPPKKSGGFFKIILVLVLLLVFTGGALVIGLFAGLVMGSGAQSSNQNLMYSTVESGDSNNQIAVIRVAGMITPQTSNYVHQAVDEVIENKDIKAVILRVESGGGMVSPSDEILYHIQRMRTARPNVKVVSSFGGIAASGGYYIAMASDHIVAEETCITGSIGVISQTFTFKGTLDKLGVTPHVITAGADKDTANNPFRDWTQKDIDKIKKIIEPMHDTFIDRVAEGRKSVLTKQEVTDLATGDIWIAQDAMDEGLIDSVGYMDSAISTAEKLAGITGAQVVEINIRPTLGDILFGGAGASQQVNAEAKLGMQDMMQGMSATELRQFLNEMATPQVLYMYQP